MFKFIAKKRLYNLVLKKYAQHVYIMRQRKAETFEKILSHELPPEDLCTEAVKARQEYFTSVFNDVCDDISKNIHSFKQLLPLKIAAFDFDPDELRPHDIYRFVYWAITDKEADNNICEKITHHVCELMNKK